MPAVGFRIGCGKTALEFKRPRMFQQKLGFSERVYDQNPSWKNKDSKQKQKNRNRRGLQAPAPTLEKSIRAAEKISNQMKFRKHRLSSPTLTCGSAIDGERRGGAAKTY